MLTHKETNNFKSLPLSINKNNMSQHMGSNDYVQEVPEAMWKCFIFFECFIMWICGRLK